MTGIKKVALYIVLSIITVVSLCCAIFFAVNENDSKIAYAESSGGLTLVTTSAEATSGSEFSVNLYVEENSNLAGCTFTLAFDSSLVSIVKDKCTMGDAGATVNITEYNVTVSYARAVSTNAKLDFATLVFKVNDDIVSGSYSSWLSLSGDKEFYDDSFNDIAMTYSASVLTVSAVNVGDVYNDGEVNSKDAIYLLQYLANMDSAKDINLTNANTYVEDNSDDGTIKVNSKDAVLLMQYLAKMDVTMGVGEWSVQVAPTESSTGALVRKTAAGIETVTLSALNTADYTMTVKSQATCITHGVSIYSYTKDGTTFTFEAEGTTYGEHVSSDWITVQAATCEESGCRHKVCTVCGEELETETIEALSHDYGEWIVSVEPTLTSTGKLVKTCANNSSHIQTATLPALNQSDYVYTLVSQSTCATAGKTTYSYSKDGQYFVFTVALEKLAHTVVADEAVSATCTESGLTAGSHCAVCGEVIVAQTVIPATGHTIYVSKEAVSPTCTVTGLTEEHKCSVCNCIVQEQTVILATGHTDSDNDHICEICGELTPDESEYTKISSSTGLKNIVNNMSGLYILTGNIDLTGVSWTPIGSTSNPFTGVFNGNGYTISGLTLSASSSNTLSNYGLFASNNGLIANLKLSGVTGSISTANSSTTYNMACLTTYNYGIIYNCSLVETNTITIYHEYQEVASNWYDYSITWYNTIGGICATNSGNIIGCSVSGTFNVKETIMGYHTLLWVGSLNYWMRCYSYVYFGCIAGSNNGTVSGCTVSAANSFTSYFNLSVSNCGASADIYVYAASIVGINSGTIADSTGRVMTHSYSTSFSDSAWCNSGFYWNFESLYNGLIANIDKGSVSGITFLD